ncbi:MAG: hypothetical protein PHI31_14065 [Desulfuromonadaceae bacterium]|nr:hypothetical protein [Desulfuromonadaceae bacterium]
MSIFTYGPIKEENCFLSTELLIQGDELLESGDKVAAIESYIKAADLVKCLPFEYALKASELVLSDYKTTPTFEATRIAGCFLNIASGSSENEDVYEKMTSLFEQVIGEWKMLNLAPLQHLITIGEGAMLTVVQPVWNDGGKISKDIPDHKILEEQVREFVAKEYIYAIGVDTLDGWRPFMIWPAMKNDADIWNWLGFWGVRGVKYLSPFMIKSIDRLLVSKGSYPKREQKLSVYPASMGWYDSFGFDIERERPSGVPIGGKSAGI